MKLVPVVRAGRRRMRWCLPFPRALARAEGSGWGLLDPFIKTKNPHPNPPRHSLRSRGRETPAAWLVQKPTHPHILRACHRGGVHVALVSPAQPVVDRVRRPWMAVGWLIAAVIMAITIIGIPWARAAFNIAAYTLLPFGQRAVSRAEHLGERRRRHRTARISSATRLAGAGRLVARARSPHHRDRARRSPSSASRSPGRT